MKGKRERNKNDFFSSYFWESISECDFYQPYFYPQIIHLYNIYGGYIRNHVSLNNGLVLKTDAYIAAHTGITMFYDIMKHNEFVVMDISFNIVNKAREKLRTKKINAKYLVADVRNLPFKEGVFDFVFSDSTLDHIPKKELKLTTEGIKYILAKGAFFIFSLNNAHNYLLRFVKSLYRMLGFIRFASFSFYPGRVRNILKEQDWILVSFGYTVFFLPFQTVLLKAAERLRFSQKKCIEIMENFHKISKKTKNLSRFFSMHFIFIIKK
jgi:hypothetical protein